MNAPLPLVRFVALAVMACVSSVGFAAEESAPLQAKFIDPSSPEAKPYRAVGSVAIDRFAYTMVTETVNSIARDGVVATVPKCHLKDLPTKDGFVSGIYRITGLKLTSAKLCNPANAPDAAEKLALDQVQAELEAGSPPDLLVQRIDLPNGKNEWRVYKPLGLLRECVACHGKVSDQSPELQALFKEKYPDNQATGYAVGQLRGLIRVTVSDPPASPTPPGANKAAPAPAGKKTKA